MGYVTWSYDTLNQFCKDVFQAFGFSETPVSAVIDGHNGMGQLISIFAMKKAIEKAKQTGVGMVSVRESNHFGIAGYYAKMASEEGLLGMACTNSEAIKGGHWIKMDTPAQMPRMFYLILLPKRAEESCRSEEIKK